MLRSYQPTVIEELDNNVIEVNLIKQYL